MRDTPLGPARLGELVVNRRRHRRRRRRRRRRHLVPIVYTMDTMMALFNV